MGRRGHTTHDDLTGDVKDLGSSQRLWKSTEGSRGEGHDLFGSSGEVASLEQAGTVAEGLTGEVQREMPTTWTRGAALDTRRSSRAIGFGGIRHTFCC